MIVCSAVAGSLWAHSLPGPELGCLLVAAKGSEIMVKGRETYLLAVMGTMKEVLMLGLARARGL